MLQARIMFSGIVEAVQPILSAHLSNSSLDQSGVESNLRSLRIVVKKPSEFNDIKGGDSISTDGVCLTVETFDQETVVFALGFETLQVLKWDVSSTGSIRSLVGKMLNLERSLRFGDRIHGHFVTGHVDSLGEVVRSEGNEEGWFLDVKVAETVAPFIWKKGSITLNGVSLTVNQVQSSILSVCLIPETLKRTNLGLLKVGSKINVEPDYMAKAMRQMLEQNFNLEFFKSSLSAQTKEVST